MVNPVRETTKQVIKQAKNVRIDISKLKEAAKKLSRGDFGKPVWSAEFHLQTDNKEAMLAYIILIDAVNFCFWSEKERWKIIYQKKTYNGYIALALAMKNYFDKNPEKANLKYFASISFSDFVSLLGGEGKLLFLKERLKIINTVSRYILEKYGSSTTFISSGKGNCSALVPKIACELYSFNDEAEYNGQKVFFWKRAQILCADIYGAFKGKGPGHFNDLEHLTAFADYKIPQILHSLGILEYEPELKKKIASKKLIQAGSDEEIEIRSTTIWAVENLTKELAKLGKKYYPFQVDWILWNASQKQKMDLPYHLTKTIYY